MSTRFDLEEQILECWNITRDLDTLAEGVIEQNLSQDDISNTLIGLKTMYELKHDKLWRTFEQFEQLIAARNIN